MALRYRYDGRRGLSFRFQLRRLARLFLFWRKEQELPDFLARYAADGVRAIPAAERNLFPAFQKCQACSLCTFSCSAVRDGIAPPAFEPKYLMLGQGRSALEAELALDEWIPCVQCSGCTVECPVDVPIHEMGQAIVERRRRLTESQTDATGSGA